MRRRLYVTAMALLPALFGMGCEKDWSCFDALIVSSNVTGAKLTVPARATAGDTITLDAKGSTLQSTRTSTVCPEIVRFHAGFGGATKTGPVAVLTRSQLTFGRQPCEITDGKVQFKVPGDTKPGDSVLTVTVNVQALASRATGDTPLFSSVSQRIVVTTPASQVTSPGSTPPGVAANQAPVARFFPRTEPFVAGRLTALDARESFDPDGAIAKYEWDFNNDGAFEVTSTSPTFDPVQFPTPGTQTVVLRVTDELGATATSDPVPISVIAAPGPFPAYGDFTFANDSGTPITEVPVNADVDVELGATALTNAVDVSLDADNDGVFEQGPTPVAPNQFFGPLKFTTGGWKAVTVRWRDAGANATTTKKLIKVTPFVQRSSAAIASTRGTAVQAAQGTPITASLRASFVPITLGKLSLSGTGVRSRGLLLRGKLKGTVRPARKGAKVPAGVRVLRNAVFAGSFSGTAPSIGATFGAPYGSGLLLARDPKAPGTQLCLRVTQSKRATTRFTVVGATGKARGLRGSGSFPSLVPGIRSKAAKLRFTASQGAARPLSGACRALVRQQVPKRR